MNKKDEEMMDRLRENGLIGLDLSPGDDVSLWAWYKIRELLENRV